MNASIRKKKRNFKSLLASNQQFLDKLMDVKSNYDIPRMERERRVRENEMERYTKYKHIFKMDKIIKQHRDDRESQFRSSEYRSWKNLKSNRT